MLNPPPLDPDAALFLDLDGTLIEIAARPESVKVPATLPALLDRLAARRGGALAIISGRRLADLDRLLTPWHGAAAGLHGAERRRADGSLADAGGSAADLAAAAALDRLRPQLAEYANGRPGVLVEDKGKTLALHYRSAPEREDEVRALAARLLAPEAALLRTIAGKMVVEFQPQNHGKHRALGEFMAEAPFRGRRPIFVGDDTTDEDGFAEVNRRGGLAVRVGSPGAPTQAAHHLASVSAVLHWLGSADGRAERG